jgi:hypothetical protein
MEERRANLAEFPAISVPKASAHSHDISAPIAWFTKKRWPITASFTWHWMAHLSQPPGAVGADKCMNAIPAEGYEEVTA